MLKNKLWMIVLLLIIVPIVSAELIYQQGETIDLKVTCSNNNSLCSSATTCNITIFQPDSSILIDNQIMNNSVVYFNYTLNTTQTETLGEHQASIFCQDAGENDFTTFSFTITPSGTEASTSQGFIYVGLILVSFFFAALCIFGAWRLDGNNPYDLGGKLIKINLNKYIKLGLGFFAYQFVIIIAFLSWQISANFLFLDFMTNILRMIFLTLVILLLPLFIIVSIFALMKWLLDLKLDKLAKRGLKPR